MQCMLSSTVRRLSRITRGPCSIIIPVHARLLTVPNALRIANYPRSHYGSFTAAGCFQPFFPTPTVFSSVPSARAIRSDTGIWPSAHWCMACLFPFSTLVSGLQHTPSLPSGTAALPAAISRRHGQQDARDLKTRHGVDAPSCRTAVVLRPAASTPSQPRSPATAVGLST